MSFEGTSMPEGTSGDPASTGSSKGEKPAEVRNNLAAPEELEQLPSAVERILIDIEDSVLEMAIGDGLAILRHPDLYNQEDCEQSFGVMMAALWETAARKGLMSHAAGT